MTLDARLASAVEAARSRKALRIRLLDVHEHASFTDTFMFVSGTSDRHNRSIAEAVTEALKAQGDRPISSEGEDQGTWILLDFGDLIVHVMDDGVRRHYDLEGLWKAGADLELPPEPASPLAAPQS